MGFSDREREVLEIIRDSEDFREYRNLVDRFGYDYLQVLKSRIKNRVKGMRKDLELYDEVKGKVNGLDVDE